MIALAKTVVSGGAFLRRSNHVKLAKALMPARLISYFLVGVRISSRI
jgi:hypothetical protein